MNNNHQKTYPLGKRIDPSLETWKKLFSAVRFFQEARPWEHIENEDLFEVEDPVSHETGYCCVMGNGGRNSVVIIRDIFRGI